MRLVSLKVSGFRGFAAEETFDCDSDVVVVVGANGNGKTSFFDAILWALSGRIPRLGSDNSALLNRFSSTGQARVAVQLRRADDKGTVTVTRVFDGRDTRVSVESAAGLARGPEAEGQLINLVWSAASGASDPGDALATALSRCVYLQQDRVRDFIESTTPHDRFMAISELVGAGRVTELQEELERSKAAWTRATSSLSAELKPLQLRKAALEARALELAERVRTPRGETPVSWAAWADQLRSLGFQDVPTSMAGRESAAFIDGAIRRIEGLRLSVERRKHAIDRLALDIATTEGRARPNVETLRERAERAEQDRAHASALVAQEQARAAEFRQSQVALKERADQLRALAAMALGHLDETCPVCAQSYDRDSTRKRLQELVSAAGPGLKTSEVGQALPALLQGLSTSEKTLDAARLALREAENELRVFDSNELASRTRLNELGIPWDDRRVEALADEAAKAARELGVLAAAQQIGERFVGQLSTAGAAAELDELRREIDSLGSVVSAEERKIASRVLSGELAQNIITALREAGLDVVGERVKAMGPLLRSIYTRIDLHPVFRAVGFLTSALRGRGQLATTVADPVGGIVSNEPTTILSSSQVNALAVCVFLALNLGNARPPLDAALLDDPLQNLDDVNLLGLIDLLRRTKDQRQLVVSTHDARFGDLLARKLRPRSASQKTVVYLLDGWSKKGPVVTRRDIHCDPKPLRLVATGNRTA